MIVWKRLSDTRAVCYRCFENLSAGKFCAQSADFLSLPVEEELLRRHERQVAKLFIEIEPSERCNWFPSIQDAIKAHDADFEI